MALTHTHKYSLSLSQVSLTLALSASASASASASVSVSLSVCLSLSLFHSLSLFCLASMATTKRCFYCNAETADYWDGWKMSNGSFIQLCEKCGFAYVNGRFCETFHLEGEEGSGWRDCSLCGKPLHCGCIVSQYKYETLDSRGVGCIECLLEIEKSTESAVNCKTDPTALSDSSDGADTASDTRGGNETPKVDASVENHLNPQDLPKMIEPVQKISGNSNSDVIPLFEKSLTASDADIRNARLVIPKKQAEGFLLKFFEAQRFPVTIQDTTGKDWEVRFRSWKNGNCKRMYVVEGLKDYMVLMHWKVGDKVTFHRMEPEGKLVIGTKKTSAVPPAPKKKSPILSRKQA